MKLITLTLFFITSVLAGNIVDWGSPTPPGQYAYKRWCPRTSIKNVGTENYRHWAYEVVCYDINAYIAESKSYMIYLDNCLMNDQGALRWRTGGGMSKHCEDCTIWSEENSIGREELLQCICFVPGEGETTVGMRSRINLFEFMYYTPERGLICDVQK